MSHLLIGADRRSHAKVLALALAGSAGLIILGSAAEHADSAMNARSEGDRYVIKAGSPAISARADVTSLR